MKKSITFSLHTNESKTFNVREPMIEGHSDDEGNEDAE